MTFDLDPTVTAGELLTVVVAVLAGAVVAIQSVHTARSAKASKDAAVAASEGLKVATKALEVASKEEKHSRTLVIEAHRARIDAALPAVSVSPGNVQWPLYVCPQPKHGEWEGWDSISELSLPGDGSTALAFRSWVSLYNGSARVVELWLTYTAYDNMLGGHRARDSSNADASCSSPEVLNTSNFLLGRQLPTGSRTEHPTRTTTTGSSGRHLS